MKNAALRRTVDVTFLCFFLVQTVVLQVLLKLTELHIVELRQFKKHFGDDRLNQAGPHTFSLPSPKDAVKKRQSIKPEPRF